MFSGYPENSIQDLELPRQFILDCLFLSYANVQSKKCSQIVNKSVSLLAGWSSFKTGESEAFRYFEAKLIKLPFRFLLHFSNWYISIRSEHYILVYFGCFPHSVRTVDSRFHQVSLCPLSSFSPGRCLTLQ